MVWDDGRGPLEALNHHRVARRGRCVTGAASAVAGGPNIGFLRRQAAILLNGGSRAASIDVIRPPLEWRHLSSPKGEERHRQGGRGRARGLSSATTSP